MTTHRPLTKEQREAAVKQGLIPKEVESRTVERELPAYLGGHKITVLMTRSK